MDVRRPRFLTSAAANWLAVAAPLVVSLALTPYLMGKLGPARYGVWCVVEAVLAYLTVLDLGVAACLVRAVARSRATGEDVSRMASACLAVFAGAGLVALLVGAGVLLAMAPRLCRAAGDPQVTGFALLMLLNVAAALPLGVFPTVLDGLERFAAKSLVRVGCLLARTAGLVWVMESSAGLLAMAGVYSAALLVEHALMAAVCFRALPLRLSPRLVDRATLRQVRTSSADAFLAMLAGRVTGYTGAVAIGLGLSAELAGVFANAARLVNQAKDLLRAVTATLAPGVSAMDARGDRAGVRRLFLTATRWVLYLAIPVHLGLWLFGRPFLVRWLGPVGEVTFPPAAVMAATVTLGVAQSAAARILYGLGELRWFARLTLLDAAFNLLLTLALVRPFGVEGVAWAVAGPNLVVCGLVIDHTRRRLGVTAGDYLRAWVQPLACGLVPLGVWLTLGPVEAAWGAVAGGIGLGLLPYAAAVAVAEGARARVKRARGFHPGLFSDAPLGRAGVAPTGRPKIARGENPGRAGVPGAFPHSR